MGVQRELEITVLSAADLKNVKLCHLRTMNPYAVVWIDSHSKASTHVAERGGANPSWNCTIRMLCRESLFGRVAKAKLVIEFFDYKPSRTLMHMKLAGTADVLLSDLIKVGGEPKRMTLDVRRLRRGSCQTEKVIGSVDIQVRLGRAVDELDGAMTLYNGLPIDVHAAHALDWREEHHAFNETIPAPIQASQKTGQIYYQHAYVEKPKQVWKGLNDQPRNGRLGILALGAFI